MKEGKGGKRTDGRMDGWKEEGKINTKEGRKDSQVELLVVF